MKEEQQIFDDMVWEDSLLILSSYPKVFPPKYATKDLFMSLYLQVCTRCYEAGCESTSLIPMADNLNHTCAIINQEMINISLHE